MKNKKLKYIITNNNNNIIIITNNNNNNSVQFTYKETTRKLSVKY